MPDLILRRDPPQPFLCVAGRIHRAGIAETISGLLAAFAQAAAGLTSLGTGVALYHPQGQNPFGHDGEPCWMGRELPGMMDAPVGLQLNWLPGGPVAVLVHEGAPDDLLDTHFALHRLAAAAGQRIIGPNWERYVVEGPDPTVWRTEVCYLLAER